MDDDDQRDDEQRWREEHDDQDDDTCTCPDDPGEGQVLLRFDDALLTEQAMDVVVGLGQRWPEPRALHQTATFFLEDRTEIELRHLDADLARDLLDLLHIYAGPLHETACRDEDATMSSAVRFVLDGLGVPPVAAHDPEVWLESTELVRWLRAMTAT